MATFPIRPLANPFPRVSTLNGFPTATTVRKITPDLDQAVEMNVFPIVDLANLNSIIANPIEVKPIYPLPDHIGGGTGGGNPVGYAT